MNSMMKNNMTFMYIVEIKQILKHIDVEYFHLLEVTKQIFEDESIYIDCHPTILSTCDPMKTFIIELKSFKFYLSTIPNINNTK